MVRNLPGWQSAQKRTKAEKIKDKIHQQHDRSSLRMSKNTSRAQKATAGSYPSKISNKDLEIIWIIKK